MSLPKRELVTLCYDNLKVSLARKAISVQKLMRLDRTDDRACWFLRNSIGIPSKCKRQNYD